MELLLNLAWLLLALPAFWLWARSRSGSTGRKFSALHCLLALGCLLVLLFPVISATDDLRAMRTEMEESPASKRNLRQSSTDKSSAWKSQNPPALVSSTIPFLTNDVVWLQCATPFLSISAAPAIERAARAPPSSLLS
jgi:hypothetical protein